MFKLITKSKIDIKKMNLLTSAVLVANLMLCAVCQAQIGKKDTAHALMLIADTLHYTNYSPQLNKGNYFDKSGTVSWVTGYSVRELHNTAEGVFDSGFYANADWHDYWKDLFI